MSTYADRLRAALTTVLPDELTVTVDSHMVVLEHPNGARALTGPRLGIDRRLSVTDIDVVRALTAARDRLARDVPHYKPEHIAPAVELLDVLNAAIADVTQRLATEYGVRTYPADPPKPVRFSIQREKTMTTNGETLPRYGETLAEVGARKVTVTATVTFEAYVLAEHDERPEDIRTRLAHEIADAIEYRSPHLTDTEPGDALVALVDGGSSEAVTVDIVAMSAYAEPAEISDVVGAVQRSAAYLSDASSRPVRLPEGWEEIDH